MWTFIKEVLFFALVIWPSLVINEGYLKLKKFLAKRDIKWDWYDMTLVFLIIFLIILFANGFYW